MIYLSARHRVEAAILPRLLLGIVQDGGFKAFDAAGNVVDRGEAEIVGKLAEYLTEASREPLDGLSEVEAAKLARRIDRLAGSIFDVWRGEPAVKWAIAIMATIRDLHDAGYMLIVDGSAMHRAYELFLPRLDDALAHDRIVRAGEKQSRHLLRDLSQKHGLFAEVVNVRSAA